MYLSGQNATFGCRTWVETRRHFHGLVHHQKHGKQQVSGHRHKDTLRALLLQAQVLDTHANSEHVVNALISVRDHAATPPGPPAGPKHIQHSYTTYAANRKQGGGHDISTLRGRAVRLLAAPQESLHNTDVAPGDRSTQRSDPMLGVPPLDSSRKSWRLHHDIHHIHQVFLHTTR
jgi:hypothetical protein